MPTSVEVPCINMGTPIHLKGFAVLLLLASFEALVCANNLESKQTYLRALADAAERVPLIENAVADNIESFLGPAAKEIGFKKIPSLVEGRNTMGAKTFMEAEKFLGKDMPLTLRLFKAALRDHVFDDEASSEGAEEDAKPLFLIEEEESSETSLVDPFTLSIIGLVAGLVFSAMLIYISVQEHKKLKYYRSTTIQAHVLAKNAHLGNIEIDEGLSSFIGKEGGLCDVDNDMDAEACEPLEEVSKRCELPAFKVALDVYSELRSLRDKLEESVRFAVPLPAMLKITHAMKIIPMGTKTFATQNIGSKVEFSSHDDINEKKDENGEELCHVRFAAPVNFKRFCNKLGQATKKGSFTMTERSKSPKPGFGSTAREISGFKIPKSNTAGGKKAQQLQEYLVRAMNSASNFCSAIAGLEQKENERTKKNEVDIPCTILTDFMNDITDTRANYQGVMPWLDVCLANTHGNLDRKVNLKKATATAQVGHVDDKVGSTEASAPAGAKAGLKAKGDSDDELEEYDHPVTTEFLQSMQLSAVKNGDTIEVVDMLGPDIEIPPHDVEVVTVPDVIDIPTDGVDIVDVNVPEMPDVVDPAPVDLVDPVDVDVVDVDVVDVDVEAPDLGDGFDDGGIIDIDIGDGGGDIDAGPIADGGNGGEIDPEGIIDVDVGDGGDAAQDPEIIDVMADPNFELMQADFFGLPVFTYRAALNPFFMFWLKFLFLGIKIWMYKRNTRHVACWETRGEKSVELLKKISEEGEEKWGPVIQQLDNFSKNLEKVYVANEQMFYVQKPNQNYMMVSSVMAEQVGTDDPNDTTYFRTSQSTTIPIAYTGGNLCSVRMPAYRKFHNPDNPVCRMKNVLPAANQAAKMGKIGGELKTALGDVMKVECSTPQLAWMACESARIVQKTLTKASKAGKCGTFASQQIKGIRKAICAMKDITYMEACDNMTFGEKTRSTFGGTSCPRLKENVDFINIPCSLIASLNQNIRSLRHWIDHVRDIITKDRREDNASELFARLMVEDTPDDAEVAEFFGKMRLEL